MTPSVVFGQNVTEGAPNKLVLWRRIVPIVVLVYLTSFFSRLSFHPLRSLGSSGTPALDGLTPSRSPLFSSSFQASSSRDKTKSSYSNDGTIFFHMRNLVFVQPFIPLIHHVDLPNILKTMS